MTRLIIKNLNYETLNVCIFAQFALNYAKTVAGSSAQRSICGTSSSTGIEAAVLGQQHAGLGASSAVGSSCWGGKGSVTTAAQTAGHLSYSGPACKITH